MKILVSDTISSRGLKILETKAEVDYRPGLSPQELIEAIGAYEALVVRSGTKVTAAVIEAGHKLKVIGRAGAGVDNIDVEKATEKGIIVINTPGLLKKVIAHNGVDHNYCNMLRGREVPAIL